MEKEKKIENIDRSAELPVGGGEKGGNEGNSKMPSYDKEEPWVKKYREESGEEPGFF